MRRPCPSPPSIRSGVRNMSSNTICAVAEQRCPSLCSIEATVKPGVSVGTTKAEMPFRPASGSVTAKTMAVFAFLPEVMNRLVPARTQPLPERRARFLRAAASEPASSSVRQKAPRCAPRANGRRKRCF
jgi:hypothetical protein